MNLAREESVFNPLDAKDVAGFYHGPFRAITHRQWADLSAHLPLRNIPLDQPVISLKPGERILAYTHEFIGMKASGAYQIKTCSTWAKNGIAVCPGSGLIEAGSINRLTLQIYNLNNTESVVIPVGERLAQVCFFDAYDAVTDLNIHSDSYQPGKDIDTIIKNWSPTAMLPKAPIMKSGKYQ